MVNGVILVPLYVLAGKLGFTTAYLEDTRTVRLEAYQKVVYLPLDKKVGLVDGRSFKLGEPAQSLGGRTYVPLRFLSEVLDFQVEYSAAKRRVELRAPEYTLTDIRFALVDGRPHLRFEGTRPLAPEITLRQNPLRLDFEFRSARLGVPAGTLPTGDPLIKEVTVKQERLDLVRVTVAIGREQPYQVVAEGHRLEAVFPPQVRMAELVLDGGRRLIAVQTTAPLKPKITRLPDPDRLVIDFPGAALAGPSRIPVSDSWVEGLRLGQLDPNTVRVVADLAGPLAWREEPSAGGAGKDQEAEPIIRVHLLNRILQVSHQAQKDRTEVRLTLAAPALPTVVADRRAGRGRLELNLAEAVAEGLPAEIAVADGTVDRLRLLYDAADTVRWAVELPHYAGHRILAGEGSEAVVEISRSPVYHQRIFVDPGHGGADPGAMGASGLMEKEVNLDIALRLRDILIDAGAEVHLARESDLFVPLHERPRAANAQGSAIFVSLHSNANPKTGETGTETYYHPERPGSKELAASVQKKLVETLRLPDRSIRATRDFVVTRETTMPAVLAEVAFLSNPAEERLLADPAFRQKAAEAVAAGIMAYFVEAARSAGESAAESAVESAVRPAGPATPQSSGAPAR